MFIQKNNKKISFALILISFALNVISYFSLPQNLVMQITFNGTAGTTLPTVLGLSFMFILLSFFAYKLFSATEGRDKTKWFAFSILISIINIVTIIFNL